MNSIGGVRDGAALWRYAIIGIAQNALFYSVMLLLLVLGLAAWQAILIVYPLAVACSFAANRLWSFAGRKRTPREFRKYVLLYAGTYPIAVCLTWAQERAGLAPWAASLITLMIAAGGVFLLLNYWVFPKGSAVEDHRAHQS